MPSNVEFFERTGVPLDPDQREFLAQFLGMAVVRLDVDRTFEEERLVELVQFVLNCFGGSLGSLDDAQSLAAPSRSGAPTP
jgi:hypothetical protein